MGLKRKNFHNRNDIPGRERKVKGQRGYTQELAKHQDIRNSVHGVTYLVEPKCK